MGFFYLVFRYEDRKKQIGKRIHAMRISKGLKQAEFLRALFMSDTSLKSLRSWEKGETLPELDTLTRMADVFGCDIGYLLCDYDEINRDIADICTVTGFTASAAKTIQNLDIITANEHLVYYENGTLSKRHILSQIIADKRIVQALIAAKQAKSLKHSIRKNVDPDVTGKDISEVCGTLNEMNMVALQPDDSINFYIQDAGRIVMDILRTIVNGVSENESHSTDIVSLDPNISIKRLGPGISIIDNKGEKLEPGAWVYDAKAEKEELIRVY